ncbi:hypothetical protein PHMEG_00015466 [Phytophthora megakarya]|uniref:Uncharacterized protein n=1 Tax=Phytophthora megakarya TaxID=4795 RepID=A0A225W1P2_9STRA|nr:hypothetical protein PHMEG_00015466 [Phytophthora megakarya]
MTWKFGRHTPREYLDEVPEAFIPAKGCVKPPPIVSIEMLSEEYSRVVLSSDGAVKISTRKRSCRCNMWQLPEWKILDARRYILDEVTVNKSEFFGLLRGLAMALETGIQDLVVVDDPRIVVQQAQCLINCNQPNLQRSQIGTYEARVQLGRGLPDLKDAHPKIVQDNLEKRHLKVVPKIREQLVKLSEVIGTQAGSGDPIHDPSKENGKWGARHDSGPECALISLAARVKAVLTRSRVQEADDDETLPMEPLEFQTDRWRRIRVHQEGDESIPEGHLRQILTYASEEDQQGPRLVRPGWLRNIV